MSYTQNIINQAECNYINPMIQNANVLLKPCINHNVVPNYTMKDPGDLCTGKSTQTGNYHFFDKNMSRDDIINTALQFKTNNINNKLSRSQNIINTQKRLIDYLNTSNPNYQTSYEDYIENISDFSKNGNLDSANIQEKTFETNPTFPTYIPPTLLKKETTEKPQETKENSGDLIEGFTAGDFLSNNGPGEQYIKTCPIQYKYCKQTGMCKKKTTDGPIEIDTSDYTDICYPLNYDGIDNFGRIMCSMTKNIDGQEVKISTDINNLNSKEQLFGHY